MLSAIFEYQVELYNTVNDDILKFIYEIGKGSRDYSRRSSNYFHNSC